MLLYKTFIISRSNFTLKFLASDLCYLLFNEIYNKLWMKWICFVLIFLALMLWLLCKYNLCPIYRNSELYLNVMKTKRPAPDVPYSHRNRCRYETEYERGGIRFIFSNSCSILNNFIGV